MKRFLSFFLLLALTLTCLFVFSSCKKKGGDDDGPAARLFDESGLLCVRRDGKYGFINKKGKEVIPCEFASADRFRNGAAIVKDDMNGDSYYIGVKGKPLFERTFASAYPFDDYDRAVVHAIADGPAELINKKGETVFSATRIESTGAGIYLYESENGKMGAVDPNGETVLVPAYESLSACYRIEWNEFGVKRHVPVNDRLYSITREPGTDHYAWSLIDLNGNVIYASDALIDYFYGNRSVANRIGAFDVIDRDGNVIFSRDGKVISQTESYMLVDVSDGSVAYSQHDQWVVYGLDGEVLYDFRGSGFYPAFWCGANDFAVLNIQTDEHGLVNLKGEIVVPCTYDSVVPSDGNGNSVCRKGDTYYVIDGEGKTVFQKTCDYLTTSDHFAGKYYLACYEAENGTETYELLSPKGKTVQTFGTEYSFGLIIWEDASQPFAFINHDCGYYADGYLVVLDGKTETFMIMQKKSKKFKVINHEYYNYLGLPMYFD